jgi:NADPH:quinone reductase-like Zn-dependent oxidoreductase
MIEPAGLQVRERQVPPLGSHDVLIAMEATGVAYAEVAMLRGRYPGQPAFPFVPGYDVVGRVIEIGSAVEALGASVVDYTRGHVVDDVRALAPNGVDGVVDREAPRARRSPPPLLRAAAALAEHKAGGLTGEIVLEGRRVASYGDAGQERN